MLYTAFLVVVSLVVTFAIGVVLGTVGAGEGTALVAGAGVSCLLVPLLLVGALLPHWPGDEQDARGARARRRSLLLGGLMQAVGAVVILVGVGTGGTSPWPGIGLIAVVAAASVIIVVWGRRIRIHRRAVRTAAPAETDEAPDWRSARDRTGRRAVIGGAVATALGAVVALSLAVGFGEVDPSTLALAAAAVVTVGLLTGAFSTLPFLHRISTAMRDLTGGDFSSAQAIPRAVLRGKDVKLTPEQLETADQYARLARMQAPLQSWFFIVVLGTQTMITGVQLLDDDPTVLDILFPMVFVALVVLWIMVAVVQFRAIDRWQAKRERETAPIPAPH